MTKTTYIATAPDGTEVTRKTDRTYSHAVLLEGPKGWRAAGFCGRIDLAHKKQIEHPGSIVVEVKTVGAHETAKHVREISETAETVDHEPDGPSESPTDSKITIGAVVQELLMNAEMTYLEIVDLVREQFPGAKTSARSVASTAAVLRRKGVEVPTRRNGKVTEV